MGNARLSRSRVNEATIDTSGDALIDLGIALVAFGNALQRVGARLQTDPSQLAGPPIALASSLTPPPYELPKEGYVRIWDIIGRKGVKGRPATPGIIPVSSATWYAGVKSGRFPKPIKLGGIAMWRLEEIRALVAQLGSRP